MVIRSILNSPPQKSVLDASTCFCWDFFGELCELNYTDLLWGEAEEMCGEIEEIIVNKYDVRRVTFAPELVSDVKLRPRVAQEEKANLHYTDIEIQGFRREARLERMRSAPAVLQSI